MALSSFEQQERKTIIECRDYYDMQFTKTFSIHNKFYHPLFGFDVIAFDKWLKVPDNQSTKDYLLEHYGEASVQMIYNMINNTIGKTYPTEGE